jgi:predicted amidohydrolase
MRIAACQIRTYHDPARSADKVIEWVRKAADQGVDVVSFPEAALCGYAYSPEYWAAADPKAFLAAEERVVAVAAELGLAVVLGTVHWEEGDLYNSLLVIDTGGVVRGRYAKTHLAEDWSTEGKHLPIYEVGGAPSCFLVCHDVRYPELVRLPAIAGAQVCYFCSCESGLISEFKLSAYRAMPISRACENTIYLVMANTPADPDDIRSKSASHGNSKIIDPDGNVIDEAGFFEERLVIADVDLEKANHQMCKRAVNDKTILRDWMIDGLRLVAWE